jgi:hypothetical protein
MRPAGSARPAPQGIRQAVGSPQAAPQFLRDLGHAPICRMCSRLAHPRPLPCGRAGKKMTCGWPVIRVRHSGASRRIRCVSPNTLSGTQARCCTPSCATTSRPSGPSPSGRDRPYSRPLPGTCRQPKRPLRTPQLKSHHQRRTCRATLRHTGRLGHAAPSLWCAQRARGWERNRGDPCSVLGRPPGASQHLSASCPPGALRPGPAVRRTTGYQRKPRWSGG